MRISVNFSPSLCRIAAWAICACAILGVEKSDAQGRNPRSIAISVTDTAGNPVADAVVAVGESSFRAVSDAQGQAIFRGVDWGPQLVTVRKLGFREASLSLVVPADGSVATSITLTRVAVRLGSITVRDSRDKPSRLDGTSRFDDFYRRRKSEAGTFFTREQIEIRNPGRALDLFMGIAGVRLTYRGSTPLLSFARCKNGVEVFVDGQRLNDGVNMLSSIHPNQIEAIEIYHGLASVPPQFIPKPDDCAAILIWTRYN